MMRMGKWGWLRAPITAAFLILSTACCLAQQIHSPSQPKVGPGYVTGRFYMGFESIFNVATAVATLDTVVYLMPFTVRDFPLTATSLNVRTVTGAVNCAVKMALWANGPVTKRATGVPIAGSNTGQACATSTTNQTIAVSNLVLPPGVYWTGAAVTTGASTFLSSGNTGMVLSSRMGQSSVASSSVTALTAPYTYATDILALDLTAATFTDVFGNAGAPVVHIGN